MEFKMSELESSIIEIEEIDEALRNDPIFSVEPMDELPDEITNILHQLKLEAKSNNLHTRGNGNATNFIDTKTFTRPKKRTDSYRFNGALDENNILNSEVSHINLRIGEPVTPIHRNHRISDVTPPNDMYNSLVTSSDFSNLNFLTQDNNEEQLVFNDIGLKNSSNYNGYNLEKLRNDTKFLENLAMCDDDNEDEFLLNKDENISRTDCILNDDISSSCNTLQTSEDFSIKSNDCGLNETFVPANNSSSAANGTFIKPPSLNENNDDDDDDDDDNGKNKILNLTFDNVTIDDSKKLKYNLSHKKTFLHDTFDAETNNLNNTFEIETNNVNNQTFDGPSNDINNTKIVIDSNKNDYNNQIPDIFDKFNKRRSIPNCTPIKKINLHSYNNNNNNNNDEFKSFDLESTPNSIQSETKLNSTPTINNRHSINKSKHRISRNFSIEDESDNIREDNERRSLLNFEEFEKSISLLEKDGPTPNENDFYDEMLNNLEINENKLLNEKMRENLNNIKKRHSLLSNSGHKQQNMDERLKSNDSLLNDNNRSTESIGKIMNLSSSSERLLNRRSRIIDDINNDIETSSHSSSSLKENLNYEKLDKPARDRDRFKTIRIFRKQQDQPENLPDVDNCVLSNNEVSNPISIPSEIVSDKFVKRETNSPHELKKPETILPQPKIPQNRTLMRPKFFGSKPSLPIALKSNSTDDLLDRKPTNDMSLQHNGITESNCSKTLKSPMGVKAKSFHNLAGQNLMNSNSNNYNLNSNNMTTTNSGLSRLRQQNRTGITTTKLNGNGLREPESLQRHQMRNPQGNSIPSSSYSTRKLENVPSKAIGSNLRQINSIKNPSLVRPNSAYYNYNNKANDIEYESGRFSPNSISSEMDQQNKVPERVIDTGTFKRPSGLRPPSKLKEPTIRSGLPRPTGFKRK